MSRPKRNQPQTTNSPFKKLRLKTNLSQEQLAEKICVAVSTIRRWEKGLAEPTMTLSQMKKFCQTVDYDLEELPDSLLPNTTSQF